MMRTDQGKLADPRIDGDRLSSLPDEILTHILSFLQTKYAVSTSVLSRRWKDLWTRVSIIDLDNQSLDRLFSDRGVQEARDLEFSRFVRRVLGKHKNLNSLMRFHLAYCSNVRPICLSKIELNAASQLEEIVIKLPYRMRKLPRSFYTLKNLKVLKLSGLKIITAQGSVFLPSLKVLELWRVETVNGKALSRLITGCPVLETVHLEECYCPSELNRKHRLTASLPFLKNLTIIGNLNMETMLVRPVVIEAARLEHLQLENFDWLEIAGNCPLSCLESARLGMREEGEIRSLIDLLAQVSNAKQMWLSSMTMALLSDAVKQFQIPVFPKLTHLTIEASGYSRALHSLLNSASKLNTLVIGYNYEGGCLYWEKSEPVCTPECLLSSLEQIEMNDFKVVAEDMKMARYLLKAGAALKKMSVDLIYRGRDIRINIEDCKKLGALLKWPRASSVCEVRIFRAGVEMHLDTDDVIDIGEEDTVDDDRDEDDEEETDTDEVEAHEYNEVDINGEDG